MDKNKLNNLINFIFNMHRCSDIKPLYQSPDYILEKWDKFISVYPTKNINLDTKNSDNIAKYYKIWGNDSIDFRILDFIFEINSCSLSPSIIINIFEETTGINKNDIGTNEYNHLHFNLKKFIDNWLNITEIKRDYILNLLT